MTTTTMRLDEAILIADSISLDYNGSKSRLTTMGTVDRDGVSGQVLRFRNALDEETDVTFRAAGRDFTLTLTVAANTEIFILAPYQNATYIATEESGKSHTKASNPSTFRYSHLVEVPSDERNVIRDGEDEVTLVGTDGNDALYGRGGDDVLNGGAGDDILYGGSGDNIMIGGAGFDSFRGEGGNDTVDYSDAAAGIDVDLRFNRASDDGDGGNDHLKEIENITGSAHDDVIRGDELDNVLDGGEGDDIILAGAGNDTLIGGAGNDALRGEGGVDTADYSNATNGVDIDLRFNRANEDGEGFIDFLSEIENIVGSGNNDLIRGDDGANSLYAQGGDDTLYGHGGDDVLIAGAGMDILFGQGGDDTFVLDTLDAQRDQIRDFDISSEALDISAILSGFEDGVSDISDFVSLRVWNSNRTDVKINADGQGNDFQSAVSIWGSDFSGLSAQDLVDNNTLIV